MQYKFPLPYASLIETADWTEPDVELAASAKLSEFTPVPMV